MLDRTFNNDAKTGVQLDQTEDVLLLLFQPYISIYSCFNSVMPINNTEVTLVLKYVTKIGQFWWFVFYLFLFYFIENHTDRAKHMFGSKSDYSWHPTLYVSVASW